MVRWTSSSLPGMVLAEMTELGAFLGESAAMATRHTQPVMLRAGVGQEGVAEGRVWLHEPRVVVTNPIGEDPEAETKRLVDAVGALRVSVDDMLSDAVRPIDYQCLWRRLQFRSCKFHGQFR